MSVRDCIRQARWTVCAAALAGVLTGVPASPASANLFEFVYTGVFDGADILAVQGSGGSPFGAPTPFTMTAVFDDAGPNLVQGIDAGFVAYSPSSATLTVGGNTYTMTPFDTTHSDGIAVSIFDNTTAFGTVILPNGQPENHYGAGFIQDPVHDGAGVVGDWVHASPDFHAANLTTTEFTDFYGVGYNDGQLSLNDAANNPYTLTLNDPIDADASAGAPLNTARLQAVPEPGTIALFASLGLTGAAFLARRRKQIGHPA